MTTYTPPLGYAVEHFGRLTLTSHDYARYEPPCGCEDSESFYLHDPKQYADLLLKHGHDAVELVVWWKDESRFVGDDQREEAAECWADYHNSRGVHA